jgi:hypothetical protein
MILLGCAQKVKGVSSGPNTTGSNKQSLEVRRFAGNLGIHHYLGTSAFPLRQMAGAIRGTDKMKTMTSRPAETIKFKAKFTDCTYKNHATYLQFSTRSMTIYTLGSQ